MYGLITASILPSLSGRSALARMQAQVLKLSGSDSLGSPNLKTEDVDEISQRCMSFTEVKSGVNWHFPGGTNAIVGSLVNVDGRSEAVMFDKYLRMRRDRLFGI